MLNLALPLAASLTLILVCAAMANQIRLDRAQRPEPRHGTVPFRAALPPAPAAEPEPELPFDPLDERVPLEEVERFLASLEDDPVTNLAVYADDQGGTRELETIA